MVGSQFFVDKRYGWGGWRICVNSIPLFSFFLFFFKKGEVLYIGSRNE